MPSSDITPHHRQNPDSSNYNFPPWIQGDPWDKNFKHLNPDNFDPSAPYAIQGRTFELKSRPNILFEDPFDLNNLRFYEPEKIKSLLQGMEALATRDDVKKLNCVIGKGGTIAMTLQDGELKPALDPEQIAEYAGGGIKEQMSAQSTEFPEPIDSSGMEIDYTGDLVILMSWMYKNMSPKLKEKFLSFLVTHGTDTLAQNATAASMMLGSAPFTVGFVGAQKTTEDRYSDVGNNYKTACEALLDIDKSGYHHTFLAVHNVYDPSGTEKVSDDNRKAFNDPIHPPTIDIENFNAEGLDLDFAKRRKKFMSQIELDSDEEWCPIILRGYNDSVIPVTPTLGSNPYKIHDLIMSDRNAIAVALTTFGSFTANPKIRRAIGHAAKNSIRPKVVFAANPFPGGGTEHKYAEAQKLAREIGAHPTHMMPHALQLAIMFYHKIYGNDLPKIIEAVQSHNLVGEQPRLTNREGRPRFPDLTTVRKAVTAWRNRGEIILGHPAATLSKNRTYHNFVNAEAT